MVRDVFLAAAALGAAALPAQSSEAGFEPNPLGFIEFTMPSDNIGCVLREDEVRGLALECDRVEPSYLRVVLFGDGKARVLRKVGDPSCCGAVNYFRYGATWIYGPYTCESSTSGLSCDNGEHGFTMSRRGVETY